MARNKSTRETVIIDRELSPDSLRFIAPPPPRGTKRRPVKQLNPSGESIHGSQSSFQTEFNKIACVAHVQSLNPKLNDKPLHELNQAWLSSSNMALPLSADTRIYIHMHKYDTYSLGGVESKVLALVKFLRKGTEIEQLDSSKHPILESRVSARFKFLSDALLRDGFIEWREGELSKSKAFLEVWKFKKFYWKEELPVATRYVGPEENENIEGSIYDDYDTPPPAKKRSRLSTTNLNNPNAQKNDNTVDLAIAGRSLSISDHAGTDISRQPGTIGNNISINHVEENASVIAISRQSTTDIHMMEDGTVGIKDAFDFLDTSLSDSRRPTPALREAPPALQESTPLPRSTTPPPREQLSHPMTPTSPAPSVATLAHENRNSITPELCFRPPSRQAESLSSHMFSPTPSPSRTVDFHINFLSAAGNYDPSVAIHAPRLRLSSLQAFFRLVADRSGVPLDSFDCLTLQYNFHGLNTVVVQKSATEDAWEKIKYDMRRLYEFIRQKDPKKRDFGIWVDPGDTKTVKQDEDESGDDI